MAAPQELLDFQLTCSFRQIQNLTGDNVSKSSPVNATGWMRLGAVDTRSLSTYAHATANRRLLSSSGFPRELSEFSFPQLFTAARSHPSN
eukprot:scaffold49198_cov44-Attheya_sp.AAC.1